MPASASSCWRAATTRCPTSRRTWKKSSPSCNSPEPAGRPQSGGRSAWDNREMFVLFEDAGKFLAGRVLSESDASAQVELESGKRVKVKAANVLLRFEKPQPAELLREAQALA